jgi:hypothetical protein
MPPQPISYLGLLGKGKHLGLNRGSVITELEIVTQQNDVAQPNVSKLEADNQ